VAVILSTYGIGDIEQGLLHVDAVNCKGNTLGFLYIRHSSVFDQGLWHRYWALRPNVALFWKLMLQKGFLVAKWVNNEFTIVSIRLRATATLWEDLGLLHSFAHAMPAWIRKEVCRRIRDSVRFAWMAAVVVVVA
jgi:hypothetical protein